MSRNRAFLCEQLPPDLYQQLMDAGFRRSGIFVYQPVCAGCRACEPIRVPVDRFTPSKSQRRVWRRNQDLRVTVAEPRPTEEKFELYRRYVALRHGRGKAIDETLKEETFDAFVQFLYTSPVATLEISYRDESGRLLAVGIADLCESRSLSSVYFYFDPNEPKRGLGTFSSLWEIGFAREQNLPHYYLGYFVRGCAAMQYKSNYRPYELLCPDGVWRESAGPPGPNSDAAASNVG